MMATLSAARTRPGVLAQCLLDLWPGDGDGDEVKRAAGAAALAECVILWRQSMTRRSKRR